MYLNIEFKSVKGQQSFICLIKFTYEIHFVDYLMGCVFTLNLPHMGVQFFCRFLIAVSACMFNFVLYVS